MIAMFAFKQKKITLSASYEATKFGKDHQNEIS